MGPAVIRHFLPKNLSLKSSGFIIILLSFFIGLFWLPVLSKIGILSFVDTVGAFFGPIFGIIIADYYVVKKKQIINKDIFSSSKYGAYYFSGGWHIKAIYSMFIAFVFSASTIWNVDLRFLQSYAWLIGAFIGFVIYYLLSEK